MVSLDTFTDTFSYIVLLARIKSAIFQERGGKLSPAALSQDSPKTKRAAYIICGYS